MNGPVPDIGIERPRSSRPECDPRAEGSVRNQKHRNGGERCEQTVDQQQNPRGSISVDAENLEDSADQVGIKWRFPGCRTGVSSVRVAETLSHGDGTAHPAHLKAESEVIFSGASVILAKNSDCCQ